MFRVEGWVRSARMLAWILSLVFVKLRDSGDRHVLWRANRSTVSHLSRVSGLYIHAQTGVYTLHPHTHEHTYVSAHTHTHIHSLFIDQTKCAENTF